MSNIEFYNYLNGRRDTKLVTYEVIEHTVTVEPVTEGEEATTDDGYIVQVSVEHVKGKRTFLLTETYRSNASGRGLKHTRYELSDMIQKGVR
jgi:hypothetical protein